MIQNDLIVDFTIISSKIFEIIFLGVKFCNMTPRVKLQKMTRMGKNCCSGCLTEVDCLANDGYNSWSTVEMTLKPVLEPVIERILNDFYIINFVFLN